MNVTGLDLSFSSILFDPQIKEKSTSFTSENTYTVSSFLLASSRRLSFLLGLVPYSFGVYLDRMTNPRGHTELLTLPNNAQDLDEVSSLEAHKQVPPTPLTPSPPETPDTQAHHPGTAARPLVSRKKSYSRRQGFNLDSVGQKRRLLALRRNLQSQVRQEQEFRQLEFESRDLQLRELRDQAASLFKMELSRHPDIRKNCIDTTNHFFFF